MGGAYEQTKICTYIYICSWAAQTRKENFSTAFYDNKISPLRIPLLKYGHLKSFRTIRFFGKLQLQKIISEGEHTSKFVSWRKILNKCIYMKGLY